ncbi:MAG: hypothetical protein ABIE42_09195 [Candidatus Eisenbacteria bacterium]
MAKTGLGTYTPGGLGSAVSGMLRGDVMTCVKLEPGPKGKIRCFKFKPGPGYMSAAEKAKAGVKVRKKTPWTKAKRAAATKKMMATKRRKGLIKKAA